ncbi:hypothetical protein SAMN04487928_101190 [Butyrivibrio proteoclasticus]|uniref:Uncharacterized protein n=1 Tax=Butyrivibrio proteoclasticus TaxID=43305 RepID=A0A1I5PXH3_9FIRM|nr:hypothetical protein SAMN04487928_101190 [Butyrivibrio proteoclasticus]
MIVNAATGFCDDFVAHFNNNFEIKIYVMSFIRNKTKSDRFLTSSKF